MARLAVELPPDAVKKGAEEIRKALAAIGVDAKVLDRNMQSADRQLKNTEYRFNRLAAELDPVIRKEQELARTVRDLDKALAAGVTSQAEHARLLKLAETNAEGVSQKTTKAANSLKDLKQGLARTAAGALVFEAAIKGAQQLDDRLHILGESGREVVDAMGRGFQSLRSLDLFGVLDAVADVHVQMAMDVQRGWEETYRYLHGQESLRLQQLREEAEYQKNLANVRRGGKQLGAARQANADIFGDPAALELRAQGIVTALRKAEEAGKLDGAFPNLESQVRKALDAFDALGLEAPQALEDVAAKYGVVSSASIAAAKQIEEDNKKAAASVRQHRAEVDALRAAYDPWGASVRKLADDQERLVAEFREGNIGRAEFLRQLDALEKRTTALTEGKAAVEIPIDIDTSRYDQGLDDLVDANIDAAAAASDAWIDALSAEEGFELHKAQLKQLDEEWAEFQKQAAANLLENLQSTIAEIARSLAETGNPFLDSMIAVFADLLAEWLVLQGKMLAASLKRIAIEKAAQQGVYGSSSSGSALNLVTQGSSIYGSVSGSTAAPIATSGSSSGFAAWAGTAAGGATLAATAAVAILVASNYMKKKTQARRDYDGQGDLNYSNGFFTATGGGKNAGKQQQAVQEIASVLAAITDATDVYIRELDHVAVKLRNSGGLVKAYVGGEFLGEFLSVNDAILAAAKKAFTTANIAGKIDPIVMEAIAGYGGAAEQFGESIEWVQEIVRAASGLSDVSQALQSLPARIEETRARLIQFGVSTANAMVTAEQWGAQQFLSLRRQITGETESPQEELARKKQEAELFNAQLELERAELAARAAYLEGRLSGVRVEGQILQQELETHRGYLRARGVLAANNVEIMQAELAAIQKALDALDGLDIDLGKIRLGGSGGGAGGHGNRQRDKIIAELEAIRRLQAKLVTSELNPGGIGARLEAARLEYERLAAKTEASGFKKPAPGTAAAADLYLELYRQAYGSTGGGYNVLWSQINDFLSKTLTTNGIAPVKGMPSLREQHDDQAAAFAKTFKRDGSGKLLTFDPESKKSLSSSESIQTQTRNKVDRTNELLEALVAINSGTTYTAPNTTTSRQAVRRGA